MKTNKALGDDDDDEIFDDDSVVGKAHTFNGENVPRFVEGTRKATGKLFRHFAKTVGRLPASFWDNTTMSPEATRMISTRTGTEVLLQRHSAVIAINGVQYNLYEHSDPVSFGKFVSAINKVYKARRNLVDSGEIVESIKFLDNLKNGTKDKIIGFKMGS